MRREHGRRAAGARAHRGRPACAFSPSASSTSATLSLARERARERDRTRRCVRARARAPAHRRVRASRARPPQPAAVSSPSSSGSPRVISSGGPALARIAWSEAGTHAVTYPAPARMLACAAIRGAPVSPREPPTTSTCPLVNFVEEASLRGSTPSTDAASARRSPSPGAPRGMPMSIVSTSPACALPGRDPQSRLGRVEGDRHRGHARRCPETTPVDASTPLGTSTLTTAAPACVHRVDRLRHHAAGLALEARAEQRVDDHRRTLDRARAVRCRLAVALPRAPRDAPAGDQLPRLHRPTAGSGSRAHPRRSPRAARRTARPPAGPRRAAGAPRPGRRRRCSPCRTPPPPRRPARPARPCAPHRLRRAPSGRARERPALRSPSGRSPASSRRRAAE